MRIRYDLWADPTPALQELKDVLLESVGSDNWTTLLLKGNWGVGKTSAVRSLIDSPVIQDKVKTFSYISLAGLSSVTDEATLFLRGLERVKDRGKKTKEGVESVAAVVNVVLTAAGKGNTTAQLPGLLPILAKSLMKDALVVIDELERRAKGLDLEEVLGLVVRLSEHRQSKVVVISNEDKLSKEDQTVLSEQREKVFDLEYAYEPTLSTPTNRQLRTQWQLWLKTQRIRPDCSPGSRSCKLTTCESSPRLKCPWTVLEKCCPE